ncbi:MAG TPA: BolA family protein [Burkholderiaceae bacterium]|nr:BolA family protein [Burkholderiaceae bacterium]HMX11508.1 BolA family protein [Burkholderiaceae bacterium]HMY99853.1 BolA family protein [Burkholderiaceae bacterium]HNG80704.1 BolA family protein [Burkholderiaceae bacterium]
MSLTPQPSRRTVPLAERPSAAQLEAALRAALDPVHLVVRDDSQAHAGHAGAAEGSHFRVEIRAACFAGQPRLARHRLVYDALSALIPRGIHALAIVAEAP